MRPEFSCIATSALLHRNNLFYVHSNDEVHRRTESSNLGEFPCCSRSSAWFRRSVSISATLPSCRSSAIANSPTSASTVRTFRALLPVNTTADQPASDLYRTSPASLRALPFLGLAKRRSHACAFLR